MKNILKEKATDRIGARNLFLVNFVGDKIKNKNVLDIGCGFGWLEYQWQDIVKKIVGIDIDKVNIKKATKEVGSKKVIFLVGDGLKLPVKSNSFEVVVASEVIEHLPRGSEGKFLTEINRVLTDGGKLFLTTPFDSFGSKLFDPAWWLTGHRHYSMQKIEKMLKRANFKVIDFRINGKIWSLFGLLNLYISKWIFGRRRFFEKFFYKKELAEIKSGKGWMNLMVECQKNY